MSVPSGRWNRRDPGFLFVNTKISGWVKKLYIDYTGQQVVKGQPLLSIYSPDLVTAQEEYLLALRSKPAASAKEGFEDVTASQQSLIESAKRRLLLWDITEEQIAELEKSGKPKTDITLQAPLGGIVLEKMVLEGTYVTPGMNLYKIADLSKVWIIADIYEYEAPLVREGQEARVSFAYQPGESLPPPWSTLSCSRPSHQDHQGAACGKNHPSQTEMLRMWRSRLSETAAIPTEAVLDSVRENRVRGEAAGVYELRDVALGIRGENT
jgi:Cu(I)/Ag(I) efflux system membrane fusion protein/cobalt-zinc-cadmium efflux system membrane fusion protein